MPFQVPEQPRTIGVDGRSLLYEDNLERGVGHYTFHHLTTLSELLPHWTFYLYLELDEVTPSLQRLLSLPNVSYRSFIGEDSSDLNFFHIPDPMGLSWCYDSPFLFAPQNVPLSALFYDFIPMVMRDVHFDRWPQLNQIWYLSRIHQAKRRQPYALSISDCTSKDVQSFLHLSTERVSTIYAGLNSTPRVFSPRELTSSRTKFGITKPFFLTVGGIEGHKNFALTLSSFFEVSKCSDVELVVVGSHADPHKAHAKKLCEQQGFTNVLFPGYLERSDLDALYHQALALCFPSLYEGFGLPVLEAMALECPVITSTTSSLPEVAGDAALLVDPLSSTDMTRAMNHLLSDSVLRLRLKEKGLIQARKFNWQRTGELTIQAWERMLWSTSHRSVDARTKRSAAQGAGVHKQAMDLLL